MFVRETTTSSDVLECPDPVLRKAFVKAAPSIGRLTSELGVFTAHVLHYRPLLVGTASSALTNTATFEPLSPFAYSHKVSCTRISHLEPNLDYAVLQCEDIPGADKTLQVAYPSLITPGSDSLLGYSTTHANKVVGTADTEPSLKGGIQTPLGTNKISAVIGKDGLIPVESLHSIYDRVVWPIVRLHMREVENHYFTYFRQYEVLHNLPHSGRENRWWTNTRFNERYRRLRYRLGI
jgi:hypothetical protein